MAVVARLAPSCAVGGPKLRKNLEEDFPQSPLYIEFAGQQKNQLPGFFAAAFTSPGTPRVYWYQVRDGLDLGNLLHDPSRPHGGLGATHRAAISGAPA